MGTIESQSITICAGIRRADETVHRRAKASMNRPGKTPAIRHSAANANIAASEKRSASAARLAASVRGAARKVIPNALTKHAAASAADSASNAPTAGTNSFRPHEGNWGLSRIAWKVSHSETKPLNGGSARWRPNR